MENEVKTPTGKEIEGEINNEGEIEATKDVIEEQTGVPSPQQKPIDEQLVDDYHAPLSDATMEIKVKTLTGKEEILHISPNDKILAMKGKIAEQTGVPEPQQRLIFGGRQLSDDKTARDLNITAGAVLHLVLALRGGILILYT